MFNTIKKYLQKKIKKTSETFFPKGSQVIKAHPVISKRTMQTAPSVRTDQARVRDKKNYIDDKNLLRALFVSQAEYTISPDYIRAGISILRKTPHSIVKKLLSALSASAVRHEQFSNEVKTFTDQKLSKIINYCQERINTSEAVLLTKPPGERLEEIITLLSLTKRKEIIEEELKARQKAQEEVNERNLTRELVYNKLEGNIHPCYIDKAMEKIAALSPEKIKLLKSSLTESAKRQEKFIDEVRGFEPHYLWELSQFCKKEIHVLSASLPQGEKGDKLQDIIKYASLKIRHNIIRNERAARQNVHDVNIEKTAVELGGHIFEKTNVSVTEAGFEIERLRKDLSDRLAKAALKEPAAFLQDGFTEHGKPYAVPNETMRLTKALAFLEGAIIRSGSPIKINMPTRGDANITLMQLIASTMLSLENPAMKWQEGLSDPDEREKDFTERMIDTFYENQRAYNMANRQSDKIHDDMATHDRPSCLGGTVNRVMMTASLFVETAEKNLPVPEIGKYSEKFPEVIEKILKETANNNLSVSDRGIIGAELAGIQEGDALPEKIFQLFEKQVRSAMKEEFPALKEENHAEVERNLWKEAKNYLEYVTVPPEVIRRFRG